METYSEIFPFFVIPAKAGIRGQNTEKSRFFISSPMRSLSKGVKAVDTFYPIFQSKKSKEEKKNRAFFLRRKDSAEPPSPFGENDGFALAPDGDY